MLFPKKLTQLMYNFISSLETCLPAICLPLSTWTGCFLSLLHSCQPRTPIAAPLLDPLVPEYHVFPFHILPPCFAGAHPLVISLETGAWEVKIYLVLIRMRMSLTCPHTLLHNSSLEIIFPELLKAWLHYFMASNVIAKKSEDILIIESLCWLFLFFCVPPNQSF